MKSLLPALLLAGGLASAPSAHASVLAMDNFTYADGDLTGRNGGSGFIGP